MADDSTFYKAPILKKKSTKKATNDLKWTNNIESIKKYHREHQISGILWGSSVWIKDEYAIGVLVNNGCYGNSIVSRHVMHGHKELPFSDGCGPVDDPDEATPPQKKPRIDECQIDMPLYNDLLLNMRSYHALFLEEAFYLLKRSCIEIVTVSRNKLSEKVVWFKLVECDSRFAIKYSAYEHLRELDWIPKCGIKFGVDYVLYGTGGPSAVHSTFSVIVKEDIKTEESKNNKVVEDCTSESENEPSAVSCTSSTCTTSSSSTSSISNGKLTWSDIISMGRVNEGAKKDLVVCYVAKVESGYHSYQFKRFVVIKRWLINKDRML